MEKKLETKDTMYNELREKSWHEIDELKLKIIKLNRVKESKDAAVQTLLINNFEMGHHKSP